MKRFLLIALIFFSVYNATSQTSSLKAVIYDFDGLDVGMTNLPDGDYKNGDLTYFVTTNPLSPSEVLGDRVLQCDLNWSSGSGEFGKGMNRFFELNASADKLNFFIYNPLSNTGTANVQVTITEDDNQNDIYESGADDKWVSQQSVQRSGSWQLISIPLSSFTDSNSGGNGVFDAAFTGAQGMVFNVSVGFTKPTTASAYDKYYLDMLSFSEGNLPNGNSVLDLPYNSSGQFCMLGALSASSPDQVPAEIEGFFSTGKKIKFVNWFLDWAYSGTTPYVLPGQEVQNLLNNGYRPIITWEMMFSSYSRLDPVQPRLDKINDGSYDSYLDAFATKISSYNDTIILRIFHEFEGDWYPWSLTENYKDPTVYINAFHHVVDRFRMNGASKVKWMWCVNAEPKPYKAYNWLKSCYPGDNYVDIVATDIYNHPNLGTPPWKSFRLTATESYYYLNKYFPNKPLYICEVGCRERDASEPSSSQTKADWMCEMDKEMRSYFSNAKALVFFSMVKEHDWRINSSTASQQAFGSCFWNNPYYGNSVGVNEFAMNNKINAYPNPFNQTLLIDLKNFEDASEISVYDVNGKLAEKITDLQNFSEVKIGNNLPGGIYVLNLKNGSSTSRLKVMKLED